MIFARPAQGWLANLASFLALAMVFSSLYFRPGNWAQAAPEAGGIVLARLNQGQFRLTSGPINRCPEKIGIVVAQDSSEMQIFPMEPEWEELNVKVQPLAEIKGIRKKWEIETVQTTKVGPMARRHLAVLSDDSLSYVSATRVSEGPMIETRVNISWRGEDMVFTRWASMNGIPLSEQLVCEFHPVFVEKAKAAEEAAIAAAAAEKAKAAEEAQAVAVVSDPATVSDEENEVSESHSVNGDLPERSAKDAGVESVPPRAIHPSEIIAI